MRYDVGQVADYMDDIDTLLVFVSRLCLVLFCEMTQCNLGWSLLRGPDRIRRRCVYIPCCDFRLHHPSHPVQAVSVPVSYCLGMCSCSACPLAPKRVTSSPGLRLVLVPVLVLLSLPLSP